MVRIISDYVKYRIQKKFFWGWKTLGLKYKQACWRFSDCKSFEPFNFQTYAEALIAKDKFCKEEELFYPFGWIVV